MRYNPTYLFLFILVFFGTFTGCQDSPYTFRGTKMVEKPNLPIEDNPLFYAIDICNGNIASPTHLELNSSDTIKITGWAMDTEENQLEDLIIHIGDHYISANYGFFRSDVQAATASSTDKYGYEFSFSSTLSMDNENNRFDHLELIGITSNGKQLLPTIIQLSNFGQPQ